MLTRYKHILVNFDAAKLIVDEGERLKWVETWQAIDAELREDKSVVEDETIEMIRHYSHNQQVIAQAMLAVEGEESKGMSQLQASLASIDLTGRDADKETRNQNCAIKRGRNTIGDCGFDNEGETVCFSHSATTAEEADEHLRDWFVTNIAYPFPDKPTKTSFTSATGMDFRQLNTWFTNMRRRSGYTEYLRTYAPGNKRRFREMCVDALNGVGDPGLKAVVQGMQRYAEKKPRGKVGDWLLNIIEEGATAEETPRPAKKPRVARPVRLQDPRHSQPEYIIAPPEASIGTKSEVPATPTNNEEQKAATEDESGGNRAGESGSIDESGAKPIKEEKPANARTPRTKKVKSYDFSVGASNETPIKTPSTRRRPTAACRPSPLRTVSTASSASLQAVDNVLRSVSGSSSTASNVSADLNFSFPAYTQSVSPAAPMPVQLPAAVPMPYQPAQSIFPFGAPETNAYVFNPNLPQSIPSAPYYHPMPYTNDPCLFYPPIELGTTPMYGHQQFMPYPVSEMRFSDTFGSTKRGIEAVAGGNVDERMWKMPRMGEM